MGVASAVESDPVLIDTSEMVFSYNLMFNLEKTVLMRNGLKYTNAVEKCLCCISTPLPKLHLVLVDNLPFK